MPVEVSGVADPAAGPLPTAPLATMSRGHRVRRWVGAALLILVALGGLLVAVLWAVTPSGSDLQARVGAVASADHVTVLRPGEVPPLLAEAVVAVEDERFYQHHGIDVLGLGRAALYDLSHACACQGGSTITGQLVKLVYLGGSDTGLAKLAELTLAFKVELQFDKQQILADYLSIVPSGYGRIGMAAAACADFHRPLDALDLGEVAVLAGMPQAPSAYDPLLHPDLARARRATVLQAMLEDGYVTAEMAAGAGGEPVVLPPTAGGC